MYKCNYRIRILFLCLLFFWNVKDSVAGLVIPERSITILPVNYSFYFSFQKPDSSVAYFVNTINFSKSDSIVKYNPGRNKYFIDSIIREQNVLYFRCFFKDQTGKVFRYTNISVKGELLEEVVKSNTTLDVLEIIKFYKSGSILSKTGFRHQSTDSSGRIIGDKFWYDLSPNLFKDGYEKLFYSNSSLIIERIYKNGKLKDNDYVEYYRSGVPKKTYHITNGNLSGLYKLFDRNGKVIYEVAYNEGRIVKTIVESNEVSNTKKAFLFGLDKFSPPDGYEKKITKFPFSDLDGCVNDVEIIRRVLLQKGFNNKNIYTAINDSATKSGLLLAFKRFLKNINRNDIVFIHFSGHGYYRFLDSVNGKQPELLIPCRDSYKAANIGSDTGYLHQRELESFFSAIKTKLGTSGQLYISIDVSHAGYLLPEDDITEDETASRGESNNFLINLSKQQGASTFFFTGTSKNGLGYEVRSDDNLTYGLYSLSLSRVLLNPSIITTIDLYNAVVDSMKTRRGLRNKDYPGYFAKETQLLFESGDEGNVENNIVTLPALKPSGNAFIVSVGINKYSNSKLSNLSFKNAATDATTYAGYFKRQFSEFADEMGFKISSSLLLNDSATKEKLINAINDAISTTKPNDYFIFNFSGYCKPLTDSNGRKVTYFVPFGLKDINDDREIKEKGISLTQLKDLLQLIPANNQLFITEAGSTSDFQKEFIQALIETSPTIAALSNKNRVFIVPNSSGFDNCNCKNQVFEQGPINYYITNLDPELNIFGVFNGGIYADAVKFSLTKTESNCDYFRTPYFDIFFEKNFVADLKYFLPDELMQSRGLKKLEDDRKVVSSAVSKRYALIIGTDNYQGKPDWNNLNNPVYDAKELSESLEKNFGYNVKLLVDAPSDSIYDQVLKLSKVLLPTDQLLIFVGGHGDFDEKLFDDGFIVCQNSKSVKEDPYRNSYIQYSKLSRMINKLPAQQILMILDVCFGGTFDERVARNSARSRTTYDDLSQDAYFNEKMKKRTRLYLTSGGKKEVPDGYKGKHSPFAVRLLQALDGKGGNSGILTATDLFQFVKMLPSGPLIGSFGDDEPGSEFVMLAK